MEICEVGPCGKGRKHRLLTAVQCNKHRSLPSSLLGKIALSITRPHVMRSTAVSTVDILGI